MHGVYFSPQLIKKILPQPVKKYSRMSLLSTRFIKKHSLSIYRCTSDSLLWYIRYFSAEQKRKKLEKKSRKAETRKAEVLAEDEASKTSTFHGLVMMAVILTPRSIVVRNLQTAYLYHHSEHAAFCSRY